MQWSLLPSVATTEPLAAVHHGSQLAIGVLHVCGDCWFTASRDSVIPTHLPATADPTQCPLRPCCCRYVPIPAPTDDQEKAALLQLVGKQLDRAVAPSSATPSASLAPVTDDPMDVDTQPSSAAAAAAAASGAAGAVSSSSSGGGDQEVRAVERLLNNAGALQQLQARCAQERQAAVTAASTRFK